jgi:EAL domain-containing protein (putative c-di-GMP-specific phosphodiesterase class I)
MESEGLMSKGDNLAASNQPLHGRDELLEEFDKLEQEELSEDPADQQAAELDSLLPTLDQRMPDISPRVADRSVVGVVVLDASNLESWERNYGSKAFDAVMSHLAKMTSQLQGNFIRSDEVVCQDAPGGDCLLIFLSAPRGSGVDGNSQRIDFKDIIRRLRSELTAPFNGQRLWLQEAVEKIAIGRALIVHNNSVSPHREVYRAIRRAKSDAQVNFRDMERRQNRVVGEIITSKNIQTLYQPVVELDEGSPFGFEALSRPDSELKDELGAHLFVAASRADLEGELDQTCRKLSMKQHPPLLNEGKLFINCLPPTFYRPHDRLESLLDTWRENGFSEDQLILEITENMTQEQVKRIIPTISKLKERGVHFALDDMGTGITNLRLLADLKPDYIKMDISLTRDINESPRKQRLADYLLELGDGSNAKVIAEGIETLEERKTLLDIGFEYGQGYLFSYPKPNKKVPPITDC